MIKVKSILVKPDTVAINRGGTATLRAILTPENATNQNLLWTSSNPGVATVNDGVVTGISVGNTFVSARTTDGSDVVSSCVVWVTDDVLVSSITLNYQSKILGVGDDFFLNETIYPSNATNCEIKWVSDNPSVATVNPISGLVCAQGEGTTTIRAIPKDYSGNEGCCEVTVVTRLVNGWLKLYDKPTVSRTGRVVEIPNVASYVGKEDGVTYDFTNKKNWCTRQPATSTGINPEAVNRIITVTGVAPVINEGLHGALVNENGRYWIAVGPNVVNPNHQPNQIPQPEGMYAKGYLDVVLKDIESGKKWYMPAVVGGTKAHTWTNGVIQTWKAFPNGELDSARNYGLEGYYWNGTVAVEFFGGIPADIDSLIFNGPFEIERIIFYDN